MYSEDSIGVEPTEETKEGDTKPVMETSSYGRTKRTGNNLGCRKESCAKIGTVGKYIQ